MLTCVADEMNYTIVINGFVWLASMTYYVLFARKWYTGPKMTVNTVQTSEQKGPTESYRTD